MQKEALSSDLCGSSVNMFVLCLYNPQDNQMKGQYVINKVQVKLAEEAIAAGKRLISFVGLVETLSGLSALNITSTFPK